MKTTKFLSIVSLTSLFLGMGTLYADETTHTRPDAPKEFYGKGERGEHGKHFGRDHRGGHFGKIMQQLDLTDDQRGQLKALRIAQRENRTIDFKAMRAAKQETLANAVTAEGFNKELFIQDATVEFQDKIAKRADNMEQMFAILTPEQRTKFVELLKAN